MMKLGLKKVYFLRLGGGCGAGGFFRGRSLVRVHARMCALKPPALPRAPRSPPMHRPTPMQAPCKSQTAPPHTCFW